VRAADMLTAPTRSFLARFQELHGRARDAQAIWNGRNTAFFHSGEKKNAVLAAGRLWDDAKNIGILREVAPHVGAPIFVAGDKISPDTTSIDLTALNPLGRLGRTELAAQIADTAVFASPARYEPFGLTILEAALSSCALALGDIATLRELWDGAAIFADPDDAQGWRQALSRLTTDREYAAALGEKARERAQRYSSQQMAEGYWGAYQKLLSIPTGIGVAA
jgi:glycosyltransferase involved in cell wall biosynthesis